MGSFRPPDYLRRVFTVPYCACFARNTALRVRLASEALRSGGGGAYPVFAARVLKGAQDQRTAAVVLHVVGQVLAGDVGRAALVGTLDRKPGAVVLVVLEREGKGVKRTPRHASHV